MKLKSLNWSVHPTGRGLHYDTATADAGPFGALSIEWKGWKEESERFYVLYINEEYISPHGSLDAAKEAAVEWLKNQVNGAMQLTESV